MRVIKTIVFVSIGIIAAIILNYFFLEKLIIWDPCYYHNHDFKTSEIFNLFYKITPGEGYHPIPTRFNFILTITIGAIFGLIIPKIFKSKKRN